MQYSVDIPELPSFTVASDTFDDNGLWTAPQLSGKFGVAGGGDVSPHLRWKGHPHSTQSFAVTVFDPDAPTMSGFWHWAMLNIPVETTEITENAGNNPVLRPPRSLTLRNDAGFAGFLGAAPPEGHGIHRYYCCVHALNVPFIDVPETASPALLGFYIYQHGLARGYIVGKFGR